MRADIKAIVTCEACGERYSAERGLMKNKDRDGVEGCTHYYCSSTCLHEHELKEKFEKVGAW